MRSLPQHLLFQRSTPRPTPSSQQTLPAIFRFCSAQPSSKTSGDLIREYVCSEFRLEHGYKHIPVWVWDDIDGADAPNTYPRARHQRLNPAEPSRNDGTFDRPARFIHDLRKVCQHTSNCQRALERTRRTPKDYAAAVFQHLALTKELSLQSHTDRVVVLPYLSTRISFDSSGKTSGLALTTP